MTETANPRTAEANGPLWGHAARDWAEIQEGKFAPGYHAAFAAVGVGPGTRLLDVLPSHPLQMSADPIEEARHEPQT